MSTRSAIGYKLPNGKIRAKYCHWDGYVEGGVGQTLQESYQAAFKIGQLIELGDMSTLAGEIADCEFYGRDKGETDVDAQDYDNFADLVESYEGCDYIYVWDGSNWLVHKSKDTRNGFPVFDYVEVALGVAA